MVSLMSYARIQIARDIMDSTDERTPEFERVFRYKVLEGMCEIDENVRYVVEGYINAATLEVIKDLWP